MSIDLPVVLIVSTMLWWLSFLMSSFSILKSLKNKFIIPKNVNLFTKIQSQDFEWRNVFAKVGFQLENQTKSNLFIIQHKLLNKQCLIYNQHYSASCNDFNISIKENPCFITWQQFVSCVRKFEENMMRVESATISSAHLMRKGYPKGYPKQKIILKAWSSLFVLSKGRE